MGSRSTRYLKRKAYALLALAGLPRAVHRLRRPGDLTVVMYHGVLDAPLPPGEGLFLPKELFSLHLRYLAKHFTLLPLDEALERRGRVTDGKPAAAVTFDDGFRNNFTIAFPLLKEWKIPATIYLCTSYLDSDRTFWFCRVSLALTGTALSQVRWQDMTFDLSTPVKKAAAVRAIQKVLKPLPAPVLHQRLAELEDLLGTGEARCAPEDPYRVLTRQDISAMSGSGLIYFGAHTDSHAILPVLSPEASREEIALSVRGVEEITGRPCRHFAYPNGMMDSGTAQLLRECGIRYAVTTVEGPNTPQTHPLELRRYRIGGSTDMATFQMKVHHSIAMMKGHRG